MPEMENFGRGKGGNSILTADIPVSLKDGKTIGKYTSGNLIPAKGKTVQQFLVDIASESIYPTYQPAGLGLEQSVATVGEVGERLTNILVATYYRGDAGVSTAIRITYNGGQLLASAATGTCRTLQAVERTLAGTTYQAAVDYLAGQPKAVQPAGTPDDRPAMVGQPYAPQAAQNGLLSNVQRILGCYKYFWGPVATVPTASAQVRALASSCLSLQQPAPAILTTGTAYSMFVVALPVGVSLTAVVDLTALGAVLTGEYRPQPIEVEDAAGNLVAYQLYVMRAAVPYGESHQHQLSFSA